MHDTDVRSPLERFAIPHKFQPRLTLYGGLLAVTAALTQIVVGSLIGALWGVRIWLAAVSMHSTAWKTFAILGLIAGLMASLAVMLFAVRALIGRLSKNRAT
jgi:hypothetical protein